MIDLAVATSAEYLPWCATLIRSCLDHQGSALRVHVLHEELRPSDIRPLVEMVHGEGAEVDVATGLPAMIDELPVYPEYGGRAYALPLLLPRVLPALSRVLYLDVDTLVVDPLDDLWATDLDGHPIAAVTNVVEPAMRAHVEALGLDPVDFLNSGVLLMDLDAVREEGSFTRILEGMAAGARLFWADQDALNLEFAGRWKHLHPRWNAMNSLWTWSGWASELFGSRVVREATEHPAIVHFEGPALCKPWHYLCDHPWLERYRSTLARTPWKSEPLRERSLGTRVISRLPRRSRVPAYWLWRRYRAKVDAVGVRRSLQD